jgi:large subunit ribosomal protein L2
LISFSFNPFVVGSAVCLDVVSVGTIVCCVELFRFFGAQLLRSAGVWGKVVRKTSRFAFIWLRSGVVVSVGLDCLCVLGRVFGVDWNLRKFSKAGTLRRLGFRPVVRGEAMNPVDHPHGGRTRGGRIPVTP